MTPQRIIDRLSDGVAAGLAWAAPAMVFVTCLVVILRYGVNIGSIALQESVMYLHGALFLLALGYGLRTGAHVRVDLIYSRLAPRGRAIVDLAGHLLFSLPLAIFIVWICWDYVGNSWAIGEQSPEVGGLAYVWLLKTLIPLGAGLYGLQTVAEIFHCIFYLLGREPEATPYHHEEEL